MLHKKRVLQTIYYAMRRRLRGALGLPARNTAAPWLGQLDVAVARHSWIARSVLEHAPAELDLRGKAVCEVGAGDCLAASSLFLAKGATRVDIVEAEPPATNERQLEVLRKLKEQGLPIDLGILRQEGGLALDERKVTYHRCYMENFNSPVEHEFLFSFSVVEHVEDLGGFHRACRNALASGGWMLHLVDLGGHVLFEDPLPPLDFQTYPDWLYDLMFPRYNRATRRFLNEHLEAITNAGFKIERVTPTRKADAAYLDRLWPQLRRAAQARGRGEVGIVEFAVLARNI
jgi:hypothetical protein